MPPFIGGSFTHYMIMSLILRFFFYHKKKIHKEIFRDGFTVVTASLVFANVHSLQIAHIEYVLFSLYPLISIKCL